MGFDKGPCGFHFQDWKIAYLDWQNKSAAADKEIAKAGVVTGVATGICTYTGWTGVGAIACVAGVAGALIQDASSVAATNARNAAAKRVEAAKKAYEDCVGTHKNYYGT